MPPVFATHIFTATGTSNVMHTTIDWKDVDGKESHVEYDLPIDSKPHEITNFNGYQMTATSSVADHKLKFECHRDNCTIEFEADAKTGLLQLTMKNLIGEKWYTLHQTYRK